MLKIRFNTISSSAHGSFAPGEVAVVPEDFATPLLEGGFASLVEEVAAEAPAEGPSEAQELADSLRDAGFTGEAGFQELSGSESPSEDGSGPDDDDALAAALGVTGETLSGETLTREINTVLSTFGAAPAPEQVEQPGEGVASLAGGDLTKPTGQRKTTARE